jgi:hypothetical protein
MKYTTKIDHIVIGAKNLSLGVDYVKDCLGVDIPFGGIHDKMGTHNHLMQLGNNTFLEVIAINPNIKPPKNLRWYGLDDPYISRLIEEKPQLLTWVVNTKNIKSLLKQSAFSFGKPEHICRDTLSWDFSLPDDGRILAGGMLPYVIEWHTDLHPSIKMANMGCSLQKLEIYHSHPSWLQSVLGSIGAKNLVRIIALESNRAPFIVAYIKTPNGIRQLRTDK